MKYIWVFVAFFTSFLYSQNKDSLVYYNDLATSNIQINKIKNALYYTQKAIDYAQ